MRPAPLVSRPPTGRGVARLQPRRRCRPWAGDRLMHLSGDDWALRQRARAALRGRAWVFERVRSFLGRTPRLLVIVAPPGSGKTAIAARLAQASAGRPRDDGQPPIPRGHDRRGGLLPGRPGLPARSRPGPRRPTLRDGARLRRRTTGDGRDPRERYRRRPGVSRRRCLRRRLLPVFASISRALGPSSAFADGLAMPLRRLSERSRFSRRSCLSTRSTRLTRRPSRRSLPGPLADLGGVRLIVTTRDDPGSSPRSVSTPRSPPATRRSPPPRGSPRRHRRRRRSMRPARLRGRRTRRGGRGPRPPDWRGRRRQLPVRLPRRRRPARSRSALAGLDVTAAAETCHSPRAAWRASTATSSAGVAGDGSAGRGIVRPILAPLAVALGDGLDTVAACAPSGSSLAAGRPVSGPLRATSPRTSASS